MPLSSGTRMGCIQRHIQKGAYVVGSGRIESIQRRWGKALYVSIAIGLLTRPPWPRPCSRAPAPVRPSVCCRPGTFSRHSSGTRHCFPITGSLFAPKLCPTRLPLPLPIRAPRHSLAHWLALLFVIVIICSNYYPFLLKEKSSILRHGSVHKVANFKKTKSLPREALIQHCRCCRICWTIHHQCVE